MSKITYTLNGLNIIEAEEDSYFTQVIDALAKKRREEYTKNLLALTDPKKPLTLKFKKPSRDVLEYLQREVQ